jgi:hypothetical protein
MNKNCLIIDNTDQSATIERLISKGVKRGIIIDCDQFNVGSAVEDELLSQDGKIDIGKVVHKFRERYGEKAFHIVAIDWRLNDDNIDGVELIKNFTASHILKHTPKILYSGGLEQILTSKIGEFKKSQDQNALLIYIQTLIKNDFKDFVDRSEYEDDILRYLESMGESMDIIIEDEFKKFPDLKFKNIFVNKKFNGKTFMEISRILESDDKLRNNFKNEIIQQIIAYLTEEF